jgi:ubiquinone/menaquinone biosynthesis C-methylase UbiE
VTVHDVARQGFAKDPAAYERGRPGYPPETIAWLTDRLGLGPGRVVLDVGAGTGKLTRALSGSGARVLAVEPLDQMRAVLERTAPEAQALAGTAEALPVTDATVDAIVVAQAFHWFDTPAALAEFDRVLRPGGKFALVWNRRRTEEPLQRAIDEIMEPYHDDSPRHRRSAWRERLERVGRFVAAEEFELPFEQRLDTAGLVDRVVSTSFIAALDDATRADVVDRVRRLAEAQSQPLRLGYVSEVCVYRRLDEAP